MNLKATDIGAFRYFACNQINCFPLVSLDEIALFDQLTFVNRMLSPKCSVVKSQIDCVPNGMAYIQQ